MAMRMPVASSMVIASPFKDKRIANLEQRDPQSGDARRHFAYYLFVWIDCHHPIGNNNDPLMFNEVVPLLAFASKTVRIWFHAYQVQPVDKSFTRLQKVCSE